VSRHTAPQPVREAAPARPLQWSENRARDDNGDSLPPGAAKLLAVLALRAPVKLTKGQWAALASMAPKGGTFRTYVSKLKTSGLVDWDGRFAQATEAGIARAGSLP